MRHYLLKSALFLMIGVMVSNILACVSIRVAPEGTARQYQDYQVQLERLLDRPEEIKAISVGTSHNLALDFPTLNQDGYHLWRNGGDIFEMQLQLEALVPKLPSLQIVYIYLMCALLNEH